MSSYVSSVAKLFLAIGLGFQITAFATSVFGPDVFAGHVGLLMSAAPVLAGIVMIFVGLGTQDAKRGAKLGAVSGLAGWAAMFAPILILFVVVSVAGVISIPASMPAVFPAAVVSAIVTAIVGGIGAAVGASMLG
jgi:hypothetical protein